MLIPVSVKSLDCSQRDGVLRARDRMRPYAARQVDRGGERRALSPARDRKSRGLRRPRRLVLGLADRGEAVRRPGGRAGRRRQFRRPGRGVPVEPRAQGLHDDPRRRPRRQHVALSDRAHRGDAQHRTDVQHRGRRASKAARKPRWIACAGAAGWRPKNIAWSVRNLFLFVGADPATGWLDGCGVKVDRARLRADRRPGRTERRAAGRRRWRPPCPACSRSATCARDRSSASAARSARARRWWRRCTAFSVMRQSRRSRIAAPI